MSTSSQGTARPTQPAPDPIDPGVRDGFAGLHHVALNYPTRAGLADALRRLQAAGVPIRQASDHGTHEALYVSDPDGNDLELAWDRPIEQWPHDAEGHVAMGFGALDLDDLLSAAAPRSAAAGR